MACIFFTLSLWLRLINKSGFKSRAAYDGACTVFEFLCPFSKAAEKSCFALHQLYIELKTECLLAMFCLSGQTIASQNSNVDNILPDLDTNLSIASKIFRALHTVLELSYCLVYAKFVEANIIFFWD